MKDLEKKWVEKNAKKSKEYRNLREKKRLKENCYKLFLKINNEHEDPTFKDTHK